MHRAVGRINAHHHYVADVDFRASGRAHANRDSGANPHHYVADADFRANGRAHADACTAGDPHGYTHSNASPGGDTTGRGDAHSYR